MDHTLRKDGAISTAALQWNPSGKQGREEGQKIDGEDRLSKKWAEVGMN
jgi:hypothetical protein